jgi:hypothetical protein
MLTVADSAYIAASRRSDRSLEARIESARRASEIHKKRTGRALRVTEQDVVNEEMYEEEDDDLPAQYQRLTAHLQTNSLMFNRKLHDYIATQTAVRNSFMQQYQNPSPYQQHFTPNGLPQGMHPFMSQQMLPPTMFAPQQPQSFNQPQQPFSPQAFQLSPQDYRQSPYPMPNRPQSHQRSASIPTPQHMPDYHQSVPQASPVAGTPQNNENRRMSLPPGTLHTVPHHIADSQPRPQLSRVSTSQSVQMHPKSPQDLSPHQTPPQHMSPPQHRNSSSSVTPPSEHMTPTSQSESTTPLAYQFMMSAQSQVLNMNPLSLSLPPESQQFVGSALDLNDPNTAILMAGSDTIPQPFRNGYHYNPNVSPKTSRAWSETNSGTANPTMTCSSGMNSTLAPGDTIKVETTNTTPFSGPHPAMSEDLVSPSTMLSHPTLDVGNYGDAYQNADYSIPGNQPTQEDFDDNAFFNFCNE